MNFFLQYLQEIGVELAMKMHTQSKIFLDLLMMIITFFRIRNSLCLNYSLFVDGRRKQNKSVQVNFHYLRYSFFNVNN